MKFNIYATCTESKTLPPERNLTFFPSNGDLGESFLEWITSFSKASNDSIQANQLYKGTYWSHVKKIKDQIGKTGQIYVCSAGVGLIKDTDRIPSYAITFAPNFENSIRIKGMSHSQGIKAWWKKCTTWTPYGITSRRSFYSNIFSKKDEKHFILLSPSYLNAIEDDLASLKDLVSPENLYIISSKKCQNKYLESFWIKFDDRIQSFVGGTKQVLSLNLMMYILNHLEISRTTINNKLELELNRGISKKFNRTPMIDNKVIKFINKEKRNLLKNKIAPSKSRILRTLRDSGYACEIKRFNLIYKKTGI